MRMMAGELRTPQQRRVDRQIKRFRRDVAERDKEMLLLDKIRQREAGADGFPPMPYATGKPP